MWRTEDGAVEHGEPLHGLQPLQQDDHSGGPLMSAPRLDGKVYRAVIEAMAVKANKRDPENWIVKITHNGWFSVVREAR